MFIFVVMSYVLCSTVHCFIQMKFTLKWCARTTNNEHIPSFSTRYNKNTAGRSGTSATASFLLIFTLSLASLAYLVFFLLFRMVNSIFITASFYCCRTRHKLLVLKYNLLTFRHHRILAKAYNMYMLLVPGARQRINFKIQNMSVSDLIHKPQKV